MTTTTDPLKLAEYLGKPAPLKGCSACRTDAEQAVMLQMHPDGTARWDSFCASCYQHTDLGSADLSDRLALRADLAASAQQAPQLAPDALLGRCGGCKHWTQHASENGDCKAPGLRDDAFFFHAYDFGMSQGFDDKHVLVTDINFGCTLFEARAALEQTEGKVQPGG